MASKQKFEEKIAALEALREQPEEARIDGLRKALGGRNNFIVAKAADLIREFSLAQLMPELTTAFDRFFENPVKTDPQCWAKNALSRALAALQCQDAEVFLRGMRHIQMEPVWGGRSDTGGTLRATCALALVQCQSVTEADLLRHCVDLLADNDKAVRAEVVRAIAQVGSTSACLLLRVRAVLGSDEPEVLGACYSGVLQIEGMKAVPWMRRFLAAGDDAAAEAALAIAGTHSTEGLEVLRECLAQLSDPWFRSIILSAIALTRQDAALEFLLELVRTESLDAEGAIEAIFRALPSSEVIKRLEQIISGNSRLERAFATHRSRSA